MASVDVCCRTLHPQLKECTSQATPRLGMYIALVRTRPSTGWSLSYSTFAIEREVRPRVRLNHGRHSSMEGLCWAFQQQIQPRFFFEIIHLTFAIVATSAHSSKPTVAIATAQDRKKACKGSQYFRYVYKMTTNRILAHSNVSYTLCIRR